MNFKRKRAANRRSGCKMCKPWKLNGYATRREGGESFANHRRRSVADEWLRAANVFSGSGAHSYSPAVRCPDDDGVDTRHAGFTATGAALTGVVAAIGPAMRDGAGRC